MKYTLKTTHFDFTYAESTVESHVLWDRHCHAQYEMIAVLEGDISIMLEGSTYRLTENQFIMIPPLFYHTVTANKTGSYKRVTVFFDGHAVPSAIREAFMQCDPTPTIHTSPYLKELQASCVEGEEAYYEPLLESLMIPLFYRRLRAPSIRLAPQETDDLIQTIIEYVDAHLCGMIRLDDLAKHTARSKSFICHHFEEIMGISPGRYIVRKKMALAQKLIKEGHSPILVASQLGYKNYGGFFRIYNKVFGQNPSATE